MLDETPSTDRFRDCAGLDLKGLDQATENFAAEMTEYRPERLLGRVSAVNDGGFRVAGLAGVARVGDGVLLRRGAGRPTEGEIVALEPVGRPVPGGGAREFEAIAMAFGAMDGASIGGPDGTCLVAMSAYRVPDTPAETWSRTCISHEAEILLIKAQLETLHAEGGA